MAKENGRSLPPGKEKSKCSKIFANNDSMQASLKGGVTEIIYVSGSNGASVSRLLTAGEKLNYRQLIAISLGRQKIM